jgi:hypothetical protein
LALRFVSPLLEQLCRRDFVSNFSASINADPAFRSPNAPVRRAASPRGDEGERHRNFSTRQAQRRRRIASCDRRIGMERRQVDLTSVLIRNNLFLARPPSTDCARQSSHHPGPAAHTPPCTGHGCSPTVPWGSLATPPAGPASSRHRTALLVVRRGSARISHLVDG